MKWVMLLLCLLPAMVYTQQPQLTQEQQAVIEAYDTLIKLNSTGNLNIEDFTGVVSSVFNNPVLAGLIRQFGLADTQDVEGESLLMLAAKSGQLPLVQAVLSSGTFVNLRDEKGWTALNHATSHNHTDVVIHLITIGADVNIADIELGDTPLIWAAFKGNLEIAKALIKAGAIVNKRDFNGDVPIIIAAARGYTEVVDLLIENGASVNIQNNRGWFALMVAASRKHLEIVTLLLRARANPNLKNNFQGDTALIWAIHNGTNRIVRELIVGGADINLASNTGLTPLSTATKFNKADEVRLLLSAGAKIDKQAVDGDTPLMDAANFGYTSVVKVFLEHCPNLDLVNQNRKTVLQIAWTRQMYEIANMIVAHPNFICMNDGIVYDADQSRYDVCREVKCCHGVWSPTGRTLETCGSQCRRVLAPAGVCTLFGNCPKLERELQIIIDDSANSDQRGREFVMSYGCGRNKNGDLRVCCPTA